MADNTTTVIAQCLCKAHTFTSTVPTTALPMDATCCHCTSCRHSTGALYFVDAKWPSPTEDVSLLKRYSPSKNIDVFFCATCSSPLFCRRTGPDDPLCVITAALQNAPDLVQYSRHIFVGDTVDGGASIWFRKRQDGTPQRRWKARPLTDDDDDDDRPGEEMPDDWPGASTVPDVDSSRPWPKLTPIRCHCGGVDLLLRDASDLAATPAEELPFFVDPTTLKYLATFDACDSCRLSFGVDVPNWTFALLSHIEFPPEEGGLAAPGIFPRSVADLTSAVSSTEKRDARLGTLQLYKSSWDVERFFCSRCSAVVFYACDDRADMVDVAVGLLDHPSGARAEELLTWNIGRVGGSGDVVGGWREGLVKHVLEESEQWRIRQGQPKSWNRVLREKQEQDQAEKAAA